MHVCRSVYHFNCTRRKENKVAHVYVRDGAGNVLQAAVIGQSGMLAMQRRGCAGQRPISETSDSIHRHGRAHVEIELVRL